MKKTINCVLLIDDDPATNFFNKTVVSRHGHFDKIIVVESGQSALDFLNDETTIKPDLIFLDINMPAMNGWEFIEAFEQLDEEVQEGIKMVVLTTSSNPDDYDKSKGNGIVDDYINKPLSNRILDDVLEEHFSLNVSKYE